MNIFSHYKYCFFLIALITCVSSDPSQAQYFQSGLVPVPVPVPVPNQTQLIDDQQKVQNLRTYADTYNSKVNDYVKQIQDQVASIDAQRQTYINQSQLLEKKIKDNPRQSNAEKVELSNLQTKIHDQDLLKEQAAKNIKTAQAWVNYVHAQVNNAQYNVSEDQQQITDEALKVQNALEEQGRRAALAEIMRQNMLNGYYPNDYYDYGYGDVMPVYRAPLTPYPNYIGRHYHGHYSSGVRVAGGGVRINGGGTRIGGGAIARGGGGGTRVGGGSRGGGGKR